MATEAFSRGDVIAREWMGWGALRVLSRQDWAPGTTRDDGRVANMERLLLVLEGALEVDCGALGQHRLEASDLLWISIGHGLPSLMSNGSATAPLRLVECWLLPDRVNATPAVACRRVGHGDIGFDADGAWVTLAAGDRGGGNDGDSGNHAGNAGGGNGAHIDDGSLPLRQRARLMAVRIAAGAAIDVPVCPGGRCWLEVLDGGVAVSGHGNNDDDGGDRDRDRDRGSGSGSGRDDDDDGPRLASGDGIAWTAGSSGAPSILTATAAGTAWLLLFVLPA
ncbi:pirin family protein [Luteimonas changyuni]|uniref:pirin family protein n=1 Tax=Luteimonas sp. MJ145 TaxID=3129234 RepID=UPI0031B9EFE5